LNEILWPYKTTTKTSIRETPFLLTYEIEVMISIEIGCSSTRILHFSPQNNEQGLKVNLDLLEESKLTAVIRNEAYRHKAT
jgi:hypothetical protein